MTFSEIPQFTRPATYRIDMGFEDLVRWVDRQIDDLDLQLNPDFQRGHVWTDEQQVKFVEFILRGGQSGHDLYFNQPGWMGNFHGDFVCVDGLQRITAIQRFLNDEIRVFGQLYSEFGGKTDRVNHTMVIHVNNLKTRREVLQWYVEMNEGGTPHTEAEISRVKELIDEEQAQEQTALSWQSPM